MFPSNWHRSLRQSFEDEQSKSAKNTQEFEQSLTAYAAKEMALQQEMDTKDNTIETLTKERDANTKQVEVLQLELQVLQSKVQNAQAELEQSNVQLQKELDDATSSFQQIGRASV